MALTVKGRVIQMDANTDVLNWVTMQSAVGAAGVYRVRVNSIVLNNGAATTAVTIKNGGASGVVIYNSTATVANTTTVLLSFSEPQELEDLAVTGIPAGAAVIVFTC